MFHIIFKYESKEKDFRPSIFKPCTYTPISNDHQYDINDLKFHDMLDAIRCSFPGLDISAFEYEDDEGDIITVWSDEELQTMIGHFMEISKHQPNISLFVYPRIEQYLGSNRHQLKVDVGATTNNFNSDELKSFELKSSNVGNNMLDLSYNELCFNQLLGNGCSGSVYRAIHKKSGTIMAVKMIQLDIESDVQRQIAREFHILDQCHCPFIIQFYGTFFIDNQISICMEYMDGGSLDKYIPIPESLLGYMTVSIVSGLIYLWNKSIIHRDVKPSNVVVNTSGHVKLCDFGVSIQLIQSVAKTFIGTNAYMAPERIKGENYDLSADIWSLGVTLYELAMAQLPFDIPSMNKSPLPVFEHVLQSQPAVLSTSFSPHLVNFVYCCLQHSLQHRMNQSNIQNHPYIALHRHDSGSQLSEFVRKHRLKIF